MIKSVRFLCVEGFRARVILIALLFTVKAYSYSPSARGVPGRFALCLERLSSLVKLLIYPLIGTIIYNNVLHEVYPDTEIPILSDLSTPVQHAIDSQLQIG